MQLGLMGGTFDPIHFGHLRVALEFREGLALDEVRLIPARVPPHRDQPAASAEHRLAMVRIAVADCPGLDADDRELRRQRPSWTIDTLRELRQELGDSTRLYWLLGVDAFAALDTWKDWRELLELAHLVVADRPGSHWPDGGEVARLYQHHRVDAPGLLRQRAHGGIWRAGFSRLEISATDIRRRCVSGLSPSYLVPDAVAAYMERHGLYGSRPQEEAI